MGDNTIDRLSATARVISWVCKRFYALSRQEASIVQLFFDADLTVEQISQVSQIPEDEVREIILGFATQFLVDNPQIQEDLSSVVTPGTEVCFAARRQAGSLFESPLTSESSGTLIRDRIGGAIHVSIPPEPTNRPSSMTEVSAARRVRFTAHLKEANFVLGVGRRVAWQEREEEEDNDAVRTTSTGSVAVSRGPHERDVRFRIAREDEESATYVITFEDLPAWAIPVEFGFTAPDENGVLDDYSFKGTCDGSRFCFDVGDDANQSLAFIERTGTFVIFNCL